MSMTKRYLESLPQAEQDAILGRPSERETDYGTLTGKMAVLCLPTLLKGREERLSAGLNPDGPGNPERHDEWTNDAENEPELTQDEMTELMRQRVEAEVEWARALMEEDERERRENAPLVKPEGECVTLTDNNGVEWKL